MVWLCPGCTKGIVEPKRVPVSGRVTLGGQPVTQGTVFFLPQGDNEKTSVHPASGMIAADGAYHMSTFTSRDGVVPGEYQVLVQSMTSGPTPENPSAPFLWAVPEKYAQSATSDLKVSITAEGPRRRQIDWELK